MRLHKNRSHDHTGWASHRLAPPGSLLALRTEKALCKSADHKWRARISTTHSFFYAGRKRQSGTGGICHALLNFRPGGHHTGGAGIDYTCGKTLLTGQRLAVLDVNLGGWTEPRGCPPEEVKEPTSEAFNVDIHPFTVAKILE